MSIYRPRVERVYDYATGTPVCRRCWADISHRLSTARYCSYECLNRDKARRQRQELRGGHR